MYRLTCYDFKLARLCLLGCAIVLVGCQSRSTPEAVKPSEPAHLAFDRIQDGLYMFYSDLDHVVWSLLIIHEDRFRAIDRHGIDDRVTHLEHAGQYELRPYDKYGPDFILYDPESDDSRDRFEFLLHDQGADAGYAIYNKRLSVGWLDENGLVPLDPHARLVFVTAENLGEIMIKPKHELIESLESQSKAAASP